MPTLSERLKTLRTERNLFQKDIANDCGIALRSFKYYEAGERKPDSEIIVKLCNYFQVSADYLLGLSDNPTRH